MKNNRKFRKYVPSALLFLLFEAVAVTLWLTKDNVFYLLNFSYIGGCLALGTALFTAGKRYARHFVQLAMGSYSRHNCPPFQKVVGECGLKWRTGGPRHLGASGHRDQKQGHIKTPVQHDAIRAREILPLLLYLFISCPCPKYSAAEHGLFLTADY